MNYKSCIAARKLPSAGGGISYQAAAAGISLCWHAQLRHATESVLTQAITQPTRQILQVGLTLYTNYTSIWRIYLY